MGEYLPTLCLMIGVLRCACRQEANQKAEAIKHLKAELTSVKERAEQVQMEKERKVRASPIQAPLFVSAPFHLYTMAM